MNKLRLLITLVALIALAACTSVGTKFDASVLQTFKPGVTTIADAKEKLGTPANTENDANGSKRLFWLFMETKVFQAGKSGQVEILFDKQGKMVRILQQGGV